MPATSRRSIARARSRALLAALLLASASVSSGCMRFGFDAQREGSDGLAAPDATDGATDTSDGPANPPDGPATTATVTKANDSCDSPAVVDVSSVKVNQQLSISIDAAGARDDFDGCLAFTLPTGHVDVVIELTGGPARFEVTCAGAGAVAMTLAAALQCPPPLTSCFSGACAPSNFFKLDMSSRAFLIVARPPDAGPATVQLQRLP